MADTLSRSTIDAICKIGVPGAILGSLMYFGFKGFSAFGPDIHRVLISAANQLDVMSENVPKMERSLQVIAADLSLLHHRLDTIEEHEDRIDATAAVLSTATSAAASAAADAAIAASAALAAQAMMKKGD